MNLIEKAEAAASRLNLFAIVEKLLTLASLVLVAITAGGQLGRMLGLHGVMATVAAWSIALVYDALWIASLRMSEVAIRQRSVLGMAVMLGISAAAIGVSVVTLLKLGHVKIFAGVPVAAAVFMGLRLFVDNVLADGVTAKRIADQSAAARNARALAAADARNLASEAETDVVTETAEHLAEMERQIARAKVLTGAQAKISKARAEAEAVLAKADEDHGEQAAAFMSRDLLTVGPRPVATGAGHALPEQDGHTVATLVIPEIEAAAAPPVTLNESDAELGVEQVPVENPMTLEELAQTDGVETPEPNEYLTDGQLKVVLRWLRFTLEPPRSYRQAYAAFKEEGFQAREKRVRLAWDEIKTHEAKVVPA